MKASSFCARAFFVLVFAALCAISVFAQSSDLRTDLQSSFTKFDIVRIDSGGSLRSAGNSKTLTVQTGGQSFELDVTPNDLRSRAYRAEDTNTTGLRQIERTPVDTYKGTIVGEPGSKVRLSIRGEAVEGFFEDADGRLFIEPAAKYSRFARSGDSIIYRAEDSLKDNSFLCEADIPGKIDFGRGIAEAGQAKSAASVAVLRVLELATEADLEYVNALGGAAQANNEIIGILNMVEGTYNNELNLSIRVVYQHTWSSADPFGAADMNGILTNFVNYWNTNFGGVARDAAHLFTAKAVAQSRGLAYVGVICRNPAFSYGMSGYVNWVPGKFLIPAHEIGHNLGADHVDAAQNCANSLMNASLTNTTPLSFCAFSRNVITTFVSANNSCLSETSTGGASAPFDFDGDGRSDIAVFRPSNGGWYLNQSGSGFKAFQFGISIDKPATADYDGDGRADAAVYRNGVWYRLRSATNTTDVVSFGAAGDIPSPADFDGDSKADIVVFRPSTGVWWSLTSSTGVVSAVQFGVAGDAPVAGDYDGDGKDDINLFRQSNGVWYRINSSNGAFFAYSFGLAGDKALAGDFDGDGKADIAVWRPSNGVWYRINSSTGAFSAAVFGQSGDIPGPADYDGDGKTDISVFRPSNGVWYRLNSSNGSSFATAFGTNGDSPVPSYYIQ